MTIDFPLPTVNLPEALRVYRGAPMLHVADVDQSVEFYALLGLACDCRFSGPDGVTNWAAVSNGTMRIMFARASGPVVASQQAVLLYLYSLNVAGLRTELLSRGLSNAGAPPGEDNAERFCGEPQSRCLFDINRPFYMPEGELRVHDPDGYCLLIGQLE